MTAAHPANRLARETSPYLLQHAHNPVDWYPWGDEAFAAARDRGVPIFLSIGYSTCYWCHVMEREVFEDAGLAAAMNQRFVNVKVDREERPDVDDLYMTATQLMTQRGGWPMSVFLTPPPPPPPEESENTDAPSRGDFRGGFRGGLKPFWCGTYIPPRPMHGSPGFGAVLEALSDAWRDRRDEVLEQADRVADAVSQTLSESDDEAPSDLPPDLVQRVVDALLRTYDATHGGFGGAPKFPQPANLRLLLAVYRLTRNEPLWPAIHHTLDRMARGGMYDQVGGGFHRYSVDAEWLVPHFEKMLYDNGQLAEAYAEAYEAKPDERASALYRRVACETCEYVLREMTDAGGAFWSAQDAEVDGREGGNYVWTPGEVRDAIGDDALAGFAIRLYGLDAGPNFRDPHPPAGEASTPVNVLHLPEPLSAMPEKLGVTMGEVVDRREEVNRRLLAARGERKQPRIDDKVIASWNGAMIAGLAKAGRVFGRGDFLDAAERAADAVLETMSDGEGGLYRTMRGGAAKQPAFLEDYAHLARGLLELHRARPDAPRHLRAAVRLVAAASQRFGREGASASGSGGYFDTLAGRPDLFVRGRNTYDGAIPSGHSAMLHAVLDLHESTGDERWLRVAALDLRSLAGPLRRRGGAMVHAVHAVLRMMAVAPSMVSSKEAASDDADDAVLSVTAEPSEVSIGDEARVDVVLRIADGFHVNGPSTPDPSLAPTELRLEGGSGVALEVAYPEATAAAFAFSDEPLPVYAGEVRVTATLRRTAAPGEPMTPGRLVLTAQPCDDTRCLSARTRVVPVTLRA